MPTIPYYPSYTFAGCLLIGIAGSVLLTVVLDLAGWHGQSFSDRGLLWVLGLPDWLSVPFGLGILLFVLPLWYYVPLRLAGPPTEVRAEELETGTQPESRWLVVHGKAPPGLSVEWTEKREVKHIDACFVSQDWQPPQPVAVVLKASNAGLLPAQPTPTTIEGTASAMGVPGLTRSALEAAGLTIAANAVYIEVGQTPAKAGPSYPIFAAVGLGVMILVVLIGNIRAAWHTPAKVTSTAWAVGEAVAAQWHDGYYYAGVIVEAQGPRHRQEAWRYLFRDPHDIALARVGELAIEPTLACYPGRPRLATRSLTTQHCPAL